MIKRVAIIGAGPAGCALAIMLAKRDLECIVFDDDKKPNLLVGESLIPASMPIISRLGIEDEIAKFSKRKEGAALRFEQTRVNFAFRKLGKDIPAYAYNIPRPKFDAVLRKRAQSLGIKFVTQKAHIEALPNGRSRDLQLSLESLHAANLTRETEPDLLVDATGRTRLFSRLLKLDAQRGPRKDIAHFAHFKNFSSDSELNGQIVITVLKHGWSWQIPLADRTSVGVVMDGETFNQYGKTAEQRLQNVIRDNPVLHKDGQEMISEVTTYANYQLISKQAHGKGWVLTGDALGFVDPMLSPGVFMALESARLLDNHLFSKHISCPSKSIKVLNNYFAEIQNWHKSWAHLIQYFYDGRLLTMSEKRPKFDHNTYRYTPTKLIDNLIGYMLAQLVSGTRTRSKLYQFTLNSICNLLCRGTNQPSKYAIKNSHDHKNVSSPNATNDSTLQSAKMPS